jgi:hypothetical protein
VAQTPNSASEPYCTPANFLVYHDWKLVASLVRDDESDLPTKADLLDDGTDAGEMVVAFLMAASGELESACQVAARYSPADLAALTGAGAARLSKLVADLAFWRLSQRRQPNAADPKNVPGAVQALEDLDRLRDGERIFPFVESADAGLPSVSDPDLSQQANPLIQEASPYFGTHRTVFRDSRRNRWGY